MLSRAGLAGAAAAASAAAAQTQTAHARVAPPPNAATATAAAPSSSSAAQQKTLADDWEVLAHDVPVFSPAQVDAAAADLQELIGGGGGRARRRRASAPAAAVCSDDGDGGDGEGRAADAVIRSASGARADLDDDGPDDGGALAVRAHLPGSLQMQSALGGAGSAVGAVVGAAARLLRDNPEVQASIEGAVARDPELVAMMARAVYGGTFGAGEGTGGLLVLGGGGAQQQQLRRRHAGEVALLPASESDEAETEAAAVAAAEEAAARAKAKAKAAAAADEEDGYNPFDPLAALGHHLSRFGAWLRAKVVEPLLGLADDDADGDAVMGQKEGEEQLLLQQQQDATAATTTPAPAYRHRARSAAEDEVRSAADAWLGALTAAMVAIVMLAILRRPAVAREFVRAAMRGASVAAAARR